MARFQVQLAHSDAFALPPEFTLLKVEGPDLDEPSIGVDTLPKGWRTDLEITRDLGTSWLEKNETVVLHVPSAIVPQTMNCLLTRPTGEPASFVLLTRSPIPSTRGSRSNGLARCRYPTKYQGTPGAVRYTTYQLGN